MDQIDHLSGRICLPRQFTHIPERETYSSMNFIASTGIRMASRLASKNIVGADGRIARSTVQHMARGATLKFLQ